MSDSSLRLLILLKQIPRDPMFISSQDLHQRMQDHGFSVSLRTIQRDLAALSAHFPLVNNQPTGVGKTGVGWAFSRDSEAISFPAMGSAAALTFSLAMLHLKQLLPSQVMEHLLPYEREARQLLSRHNCQKFQDWLDKVRVSPLHFLKPPQLEAATVDLIYQALLDNRQFLATYKGKPNRLIHPYGLVQQGHTLYLLCRFYDFEDVRITALQRYTDVQLLDDEVRPFPEFRVDYYLREGAMQWLLPDSLDLRLVLRVSENLASHISETPLADSQLLEPDAGVAGCSLVRAWVQDSDQLRYWLLSQCNQLEVLEPAALRDWMINIARDQSRKYLG